MICTFCGASGHSHQRSLDGQGKLTYACGPCLDARLGGYGITKPFLAGVAIVGLIVLAILVVA